MSMTAKITSKGQITIPKQVRELLGADTGSVVIFEQVENHIVIKTAKTLLDYKGVLRGKTGRTDPAESRKLAKAHVARKVMDRG